MNSEPMRLAGTTVTAITTPASSRVTILWRITAWMIGR